MLSVALYSNQEELFLIAFMALMKEKPFEQISVNELSEKAGMSRRTFYRHFKSMETILECVLQDRIDYFVSHCSRDKPGNFKALVKSFFDFWYYEKTFLNILRKSKKLDLFLQFFIEQTRNVMSEAFPVQNEYSCHEAYMPYFIASGLCGILVKWLEDGATLKPEDMVQVASHIMKSDGLAQK